MPEAKECGESGCCEIPEACGLCEDVDVEEFQEQEVDLDFLLLENSSPFT